MGEKNLGTLLDDINGIFEGECEVSEDFLELFAQNLKDTLRRALTEAGTERATTLRMSNLGTPDRKLWYSLKDPMRSSKGLSAREHINFTFGHIIEEYLLFLVRQAGHDVTHEQEEVEIDGIVGHLDCCIDGVPVDVKSASDYGFKKFSEGTLLSGDDPFGYIHQISGYAKALGKDSGAFLAMNKNRGTIALLEVDGFFLENTEERIKHINEIMDHDTPPTRCYSDEPMGKGGNRKLTMPCVFCPFKWECWGDLRVFQYSGGPVYFTEVASLPKVPETTSAYRDVTKEN